MKIQRVVFAVITTGIFLSTVLPSHSSDDYLDPTTDFGFARWAVADVSPSEIVDEYTVAGFAVADVGQKYSSQQYIVQTTTPVAVLSTSAMTQVQEPPQGNGRGLSPEIRQQIQTKLPELRREIQSLPPEKQAEPVMKFLEGVENLSAAQRQTLREVILRHISNTRERTSPNNATASDNVADPNNPFNHSLTALTDFGTKNYEGKTAGLYPDGSNERPATHTTAGLQIAKTIRPLDGKGNIDETNGKIVWLAVGMSNTTMETQTFLELMKNRPEKNPKLELVDGAFGGQDINQIGKPDAPYWNNIVEQRLRPRGLTPEQVQIVWCKEAEARPSNHVFDEYTTALTAKYAAAMRLLKQKFPNVKLVYLSPRTYGGYAKTKLNPEPFAWYTGWTIKFLIESQIKGDANLRFNGDNAPVAWLSWGPYLWANGENPNADGLAYVESDFAADGTHPSPSGRKKVAETLHRFFTTDETTVPWFVRQP